MPNRTLILMRHAKSDWSGNEPDRKRPIGKRGRRQAAEAGCWLDEHAPDLDLVITSPARRARSTWEVAATEFAGKPRVATDERIYTLHDHDLLAVLRGIDDGIASTLLVGHNPVLDDLVREITGEEVTMVTSALAVMTFNGSWRDLAGGTCDLAAFGRPPAAV